MPGKLQFRWTGPFWIIGAYNETFQLGMLAGEALSHWVNGFRLKPYCGLTPHNPFTKHRQDLDKSKVGTTADRKGITPEFQ